jgi:mono/diheme cytochrome c family protein
MKQSSKVLSLAGLVMAMAFLQMACNAVPNGGATSTGVSSSSGVAGSATGGSTVGTPASLAAGETLYANYCAQCHSSFATSSMLGASPTQIQNAIDGNKGGMGQLSFLSPQDVQDISDALSASASGGGSSSGIGNDDDADESNDSGSDMDDDDSNESDD